MFCPCSTLSQCCHAVVALLYPFVWQHTYIPVLPSAMLDIVCTPTPFIVGLLSSSLTQLNELPLEEVRLEGQGANLCKIDFSELYIMFCYSLIKSYLQCFLDSFTRV